MIHAFRRSVDLSPMSFQGFDRQLVVVLFVVLGKMATAVEAHRCCDRADAHEALDSALSGIEQQLPYPIHSDRALQLHGGALEMLFGSFE